MEDKSKMVSMKCCGHFCFDKEPQTRGGARVFIIEFPFQNIHSKDCF